MNIRMTDTVDSVVVRNLKAAKVLSKHGIDYCSEGGKSIKEACAEANVSFRKLMRTIEHAELYHSGGSQDVATFDVAALTRYVERYHHKYMYDDIAFLRVNLARLARVYGKEHPELDEMNSVFGTMSADLMIHMQHEEMIVFPYIRLMAKKSKGKPAIYKATVSPIREAMLDHRKSDPCLRRLAELSHHYQPPHNCGSAYRITYDALKAFESDLHEHLMIENDLLFPKAVALEEQYDGKTWLMNN